jgi:hypothetical protein
VVLDAPAKQTLGAARITAPAGFVVTGVAADATTETSFTDNEATFNYLDIPAGGSETVTVTAEVPCEGSASTWSVGAKQSNQYNGDPGNDLQLDVNGSDVETAVSGVCKPCPANEACDATLNSGSNKFSIRSATGGAGNLTLAFGSTLSVDCSSLGHQAVMSDTALFNITATDREKIASLIVPRRDVPGGDVANLDLCFGAPYDFEGAAPALQSTFDWDGDGTVAADETLYVGLLPDCANAEDHTCVFNRDRVQRNDGIIEARLRAGDPGMRG